MLVKTIMSIDEGVAVAPLIYARVAGRYGFLMIYLVVGTFAGVVAGSCIAVVIPFALALSGRTAPPSVLGILLPAIEVVTALAGLWLGSQQANRKYVKRYIDGLIELGHRQEDEISFELIDGGLAISGGGMRHAIDWPAFLEIAPAPQHWLLITGPMSFILPKRAFSSADQERSFLAEVAGHLTPEARNRSAEAIATAFG